MSVRCETIGTATLYQADALHVLGILKARAFGGLLTDPPYSSGGAFKGDRAGPTNAKYVSSAHRDLYPAFQGDTRDQRSFFAWSTLWLGLAQPLVVPGALACVFTDWRQLPTTTDALQAAGWVWRGIVPWDKTERGRPQLGRYRAQAEYVVWGTDGPRRLAGHVAPGVFRLPIPKEKHHMAGKPVELMEGLMAPMDNGPVLDPFMGSGTVGLACQAQGRPYVGIEVDATYFEIACRRLQEGLNGASSRAATGDT